MDLFELTRALIDVESVSGRERAVGELLAARLEALAGTTGGVIERMPVAGGEEGRCNLFASWGRPEIVLSTHMDTVPPFLPSREDAEAIHGRGACDAKGAIAAMLCAAGELLGEGRRGFGLLLVVGEETDSAGAVAANREPRGARWLIDGEPTGNRLAAGSKGALYLALEASGRMAHSAYPELGDSAVDRLLAALARLREVPLPVSDLLGETTLNIGTLSGGRAPNVVADEARAEVMIRTVGDTAELRRALEAAALGGGSGSAGDAGGAGSAGAAPAGGVRVAAWRESRAMRLRTLPGFATTVVRFTSDVPRLPAWGEPFLLGPGSIHLAHTPEERVGKDELREAVRLYARLVRQLQDAEPAAEEGPGGEPAAVEQPGGEPATAELPGDRRRSHGTLDGNPDGDRPTRPGE
jgi:acetylornithine deacetylase